MSQTGAAAGAPAGRAKSAALVVPAGCGNSPAHGSFDDYDTLNLLPLSVAYGGRALPLGWVRVPHAGHSNLALQQELLRWGKACLPPGARATVSADREFHSIHLAQWIAETLHLDFVLRLKADTQVEMDGNWYKAGELVWRGRTTNWFEDKGAAVNYPDEEWFELLSEANVMGKLITDYWAVMAEFDRQQRVKLVVDEWGAWDKPGSEVSNAPAGSAIHHPRCGDRRIDARHFSSAC